MSKRLNKFITPTIQLLFLVLMTSASYRMSSLLYSYGTVDAPTIHHSYALIGGFGIWLAFTALLPFLETSRSSFIQNNFSIASYEWIGKVISSLGGVGVFALLLGSMLLAMAATLPQKMVAESRDALLFRIVIGLILLVGFCLIAFWSRFRVPDRVMILLNNKVIYPGTIYRMWPFLSYDLQVVEQEQKIEIKDLPLHFSDLLYVRVDVNTSVMLDIEAAKRASISSLKYDSLRARMMELLSRSIKKRSEDVDLVDLLTEPALPRTTDRYDAFPLRWDGKATYSYCVKIQ